MRPTETIYQEQQQQGQLRSSIWTPRNYGSVSYNQILKEKAEQNHATTIHQKAKEQRPPQFGARPRPHKISCCPRTCTHTHK